MPEAALWICFALAGVCLLYVGFRGWRDAVDRRRIAHTVRWTPPAPPHALPKGPAPPSPDEVLGSGEDRIAALVVALLLALTGTAAAVIDEKVGPPAKVAESKPVKALNVSTSDQEHRAFRRISHVHSGPLADDLCLVRFYEHARGPKGPWWARCDEGRSLDTVGAARSRLALRHDWGPYDARAQYTVPEGTEVLYIQGPVAPQCHRGEKRDCERYRGGGEQFFFPDSLDPKGAERDVRCARSRTKGQPPSNAARYRRC